MYFAIRDDDTSFFTKPEDLEKAYDFLQEGCVSLSVIPFGVRVHKETSPYSQEFENIPATEEKCISDNKELVEYLKKGIKSGRYSIMLHGFSHRYKQVGGKWLPEMLWKDADRLSEEVRLGKEVLQKTFGVEPTVFVAPSNRIDAKGVAAIEKYDMNFSGTIWKEIDRKIDLYYIKNYFHRTYFHFRYKMPYSGIYCFKSHKELYAHAITTLEKMKKIYSVCKKKNLPFIVYTHYWDLNQNPEKKEVLKELYAFCLADGCSTGSIESYFNAR